VLVKAVSLRQLFVHRAIDWVMERSKELHAMLAYEMTKTSTRTYRLYADDVVLLAEHTDSLREALEKFNQTTSQLGLQRSSQKNKGTEFGLR